MGYGQRFLPLNAKENSSEMRDCGRLRAMLQVVGYEDEIVCPKPRKMDSIACYAQNLMKLTHQSLPVASTEYEAGYEILDIFLSKSANGELDCSSPYFGGSPPSRASNPLIHDVNFVHQRLQTSGTVLVEPKPVKRPTFQASPSIRIEGFDCSEQV